MNMLKKYTGLQTLALYFLSDSKL